jgi:hypothetical protein
MPSFIRLGGALGALTLALAAPLGAQSISSRLPLVELTPYAGYMITGSFVEGPVGVSLGSASGSMYGAQLSIPLTSAISVMGNIAGSRGNLELGLPIIGGISVGETKTLLYDAGLQLSAPGLVRGNGSLIPFVQAGLGAMRQDFQVAGLASDVTSFTWNAGLGVDLAFGSMFGVRILAKDYVSKFDIKEATGIDAEGSSTDNWTLVAGVRFSF